MKCFIVIAALALFFLCANSAKSSGKKGSGRSKEKPTCKPPLQPLDPANTIKEFGNIINGVWASSPPGLSKAGVNYKKELLALLPLNNTKLFFHVYAVSMRYGVHSPFAASSPSLCNNIKLIQANLAFDATGNVTLIREAIPQLVDGMDIFSNRVLQTATTKAGCPVVVAQVKPNLCPDIGSDFFHPAWKSYGNDFPETYKKALFKLIKTSPSVWSDRALAVYATTSILPVFQNMTGTFNFDIPYQSMNVLLTGPMDKHCCKNFTDRFQKQIEVNREETIRVNTVLLERLPVPAVINT